MIFENLRNKIAVSDEEFDELFPDSIQEQSNRHFTSIHLAQKATEFLVEKKAVHILDIGSGIGKYCLVASTCSKAHFTGVEYRKNQSDLALTIAENYGIENVSFINANILDVEFKSFDGFYMFNPFLENIDSSAKMDETVLTGRDNYYKYRQYVLEQLNMKEIGTRLVTYWTSRNDVPESFQLIRSFYGDTLRFWEKVS